MIEVTIDNAVQNLAVGLIEATGVTIGESSPELQAHCDTVAARVRQEDSAGGESRRQAVRALLRAGGFKPAGRSKPAQEYLLRGVNTDGVLPQILNVVDWLNAVSVSSGMPISLLGRERVGAHATLRYGRTGERFAFNRAGQELDLEGLICFCAGSGDDSLPLGTPVKDSVVGKVTTADHNILICIYAPRDAVAMSELAQLSSDFGEGLKRWCGAADFRSWTLAAAP
jgi:DNA/RNA-binding domain of Phe-tRNA-synthetase-like protein